MNFELDAPATIRACIYGRVLSLVDRRGRDNLINKSEIAKVGGIVLLIFYVKFWKNWTLISIFILTL